MKINKSFFFLVFISIVIVALFHVIAIPFWGQGRNINMNVSKYEAIITMFVLPIVLQVFHYYVFSKYRIKVNLFFISLFFVFFCIWLSSYLHFLNWGYSIGDIANTDNETNEIIGLTRIVGYLVSIITFVFFYFRLKNNYKKGNS